MFEDIDDLPAVGNPFDENIADVLESKCEYNPTAVSAWLINNLPIDYRITEEQFHSNSYKKILYVLTLLAEHRAYFEYSANMLLQFSTCEISLDIYDEKQKAQYILNSLFYNACTKVEYSLSERQLYLSKQLDHLKVNKTDYFNVYKLLSLIRLLKCAADYDKTGEYDYIQDDHYEHYIAFCVESLMGIANTEDHADNQLALFAETQIHDLLEFVIDATNIHGASLVPIIIFKLYPTSTRQWTKAPHYSLSKLQESIDNFEKETDTDPKHIADMKFRMEQLRSLFSPDRSFISDNLTLRRGSKTDRKECIISLDSERNDALDIHAEQSLAERLIYSDTDALSGIIRNYPKVTYLIGSIGFIVSDIPHSETSKHERVFKSIPIKIPEFVIAKQKSPQYRGHAEEACFEYLLDDNHIQYLIAKFKSQYDINAPYHKIYAVVLDFHGTYDMCVNCSNLTLNFQNSFRDKLLQAFSQQKLKTLRKYPEQLPVVVRYSSDVKYHYPYEKVDLKKQGELSLLQGTRDKRNLQSNSPEYPLQRCDINQFSPNLLIHSAGYRNIWDKRRNEFKDKNLILPAFTAFTTAYQGGQLTETERQKSCTRLGKVNTSF